MQVTGSTVSKAIETKNPNSGYISDFYKRPIMSEGEQV